MERLITNLDTNLGPVIREQLDENFKKLQNGVDDQSDTVNKQIKDMLGDVPLQDQNEVTQARIDASGKAYQTMKTRMDVDQTTAETALKEGRDTKVEVELARSNNSGKTYSTLKERIDSQEEILSNDINNKISQITTTPETFKSLTALKSAYPNGKAGIFVTVDNGHKYIWENNQWQDAGIYQSVGIPDGSVSPTELKMTIIPTNKKLRNYEKVSIDTVLYVLNEPLLQKGIVNITGNFAAGTVDLYILKRYDSYYTVLKRVTAVTKQGWQSIITNYYSSGNGDEYIGVVGPTYYSTTGGNGFFNLNDVDKDAQIFNIVQGTDNYDIAVFPTFESGPIVDKIDEVNKIADSLTGAPMISFFGDEEKDFTAYTKAGAFKKTYIPKNPLEKGNISIHMRSALPQQGKVYILKKDGMSFTVLKAKDVALTGGNNIIDMNYETQGDGCEYIGYYASVYYSQEGGKGFFETPNSDTSTHVEGETFDVVDNTSGNFSTYNLAVYPEYKTSLPDQVKKLSSEINSISSLVSLTDFKTPKYQEISDSVGFVGRWFDTTINDIPVKATINEGSEFYFKVKGTTKININFLVNSVHETPYFAYSIDGSEMTRQLITNPFLPTVTENEHIIRVVVDGLTEGEDKWLGEKGIAFKDVTVDDAGIITGIVPKNRKILFYGDSITEGVRVLNMNANSEGNSATGAFSFVASENLNAISYRVGFGASGITRGGSGGVPSLIHVIDEMTSKRAAPYIEPDMVVINMGTNDSNATADDFVNGYNEVLDRLSIKYSGTPIFAMIPFNGTKRNEIKTCVEQRKNIYLIDTINWEIETTDGTHPNLAGGIVAGKNLSEKIINVLGKDYFV